MHDLSVLIPARNEEWLQRTVSDVLIQMRADTEIIVVLDGAWPTTPMKSHDRVSVIYRPTSIGQRAATNEAARVSDAPFIMKLDAHCTVDVGFDAKLIELAESLEPGTMQVPRQYNLHVFDWVCRACGWKKYQGPTPEKCPECGKQPEREVVWRRRRSTETTAWRFDRELHFQYWNEFKRSERGQETPASETMSLLGACWFVSREHYWKLGGLDEAHGSWGQMGTELACKWWLSGSRVVCNKNTWFAHMFRTQGGDFSFPYPISHRQTSGARSYSRDLWQASDPDAMPKWNGAIRPLRWMLDHFGPVPGWGEVSANEVAAPSSTEEGAQDKGLPPSVGAGGGSPTKGVVYYSDCRPERYILDACAKKLISSMNGHRLVPVTLGEPPIHFHDYCVTIKRPDWQRGILTMFRQILTGLEALDTDYAFLCEHDVLYHPSHFAFQPPRDDVFYYNEHTYKVDAQSGQAVFYYTKQTSGLCANRLLLIEHYHKRIAKLYQNQRDTIAAGEKVRRDGYSRHMGFEPGCHMEPRGVDKYPAEKWMSEFPNVDIRHGANLTPTRWTTEEFRNKDSCLGWKLVDEIPGWGKTKGRFAEWLREVT